MRCRGQCAVAWGLLILVSCGSEDGTGEVTSKKRRAPAKSPSTGTTERERPYTRAQLFREVRDQLVAKVHGLVVRETEGEDLTATSAARSFADGGRPISKDLFRWTGKRWEPYAQK